MQQLSSLDSWFLHLENNRMPMHIGAIYIFAPDDPNKKFKFKDFRKFMKKRLHLSDVFRRRLIEVPMNMGRPFWVDDPEFNLDNHMLHIALPKPVNRRTLADTAAQFYNPPMDRTRPLWRMIFISGLKGMEDVPKNAFAMVVQVHHANIDGISGAEIMATIFDMLPEPRTIKPPEKKWKPAPIPSYKELIARSYIDRAGTPAKVFNFIKDAGSNLYEVAKTSKKEKMTLPTIPMTSPKTILNVPVTANKIFGAVDIELDRIKKIKDAFGAKVNDVILAICSSALRKYLSKKNKLPKKPLVAMAPISIRSKKESGAGGNRISGMLISLATDVKNPIERLLKVKKNAEKSKIYSKATPVDQIVELIPSEVGALASRFYTQMGLANLHKPFFNLVITNVPGPPIPLYMNGFRLHNHYGLGVTFEGIGLMIVVFSYAGNVSICATSCRDIMPDIHDFAQYIRKGLEELEKGLKKMEKKKEATIKKKEKLSTEEE